MAGEQVINKTMERSDLDSPRARGIVAELNALITRLAAEGLKVSSWYGRFDLTGDRSSDEVINRGYGYEPLEGSADDKDFPWFLYWEIAWVALHAEFRPGQSVLDLGGSSSLFSYYVASKGLRVTTVDLQEHLVENANHVARRMGWPLSNHVRDMRTLEFDARFDHITSICVYEHIPLFDRVEINRNIEKLLVPGGRFSITFDYRNPSRLARIGTPAQVLEQFVRPSGLKLRGNQEFTDTGRSYLLHPFYHPRISWAFKKHCVASGQFRVWELLRSKRRNDYTFGALFQEKA